MSSSSAQLDLAEFLQEADCCGALGCRETEDLVKVEKDGATRVLCRFHATEWSR